MGPLDHHPFNVRAAPYVVERMNHISRTPDEDAVPPQVLDSLRAALLLELETPELADGQLPRALHAFVEEARDRGLRAEQVLVQLHTVWDSVTDSRALANAREQKSLRERLVTMCIEHYYRAVLVFCLISSLASAA